MAPASCGLCSAAVSALRKALASSVGLGTNAIDRPVGEHLIEVGGSVAICGWTRTEVQSAAAEPGERALRIVGDTGDNCSCARYMVEEPVAHFGRLHIVVNNAGLGVVKPLAEMSAAEWQLQVDMNPGSVFYSSKAALRASWRAATRSS